MKNQLGKSQKLNQTLPPRGLIQGQTQAKCLPVVVLKTTTRGLGCGMVFLGQ